MILMDYRETKRTQYLVLMEGLRLTGTIVTMALGLQFQGGTKYHTAYLVQAKIMTMYMD